jgi:hypothetical protein
VSPCEGHRPRTAPLELADILRACVPEVERLSRDQVRVIRDLIACRSAALGGRLWRCNLCGHERPTYNSCRNRHCPKCQNLDQALWVEAQARNLLPVPYFHLVFTLSPALHPFFRRQPEEAYALLFAAAAQTLLQVARTNLGATPGFIAVLHTWTQTLLYHPHIHCIVTGGGLSLDLQRWISTRPTFFLPVARLSQVFRAKLLSSFRQALDSQIFRIERTVGRRLLRQAAAKEWNVFSKPPAAGPEQVLRYLGSYTHRIAISNERLLAFDQDHVTFRYKDRAHRNRRRPLRLPAQDFVSRFLRHVVPRRYVRVRHFGLLANNLHSARLARARELLHAPAPPEPQPEPRQRRLDLLQRLIGLDPTRCPVCRKGTLELVAQIPRLASPHARSP